MNLNCQPDDMAIVVRVLSQCPEEFRRLSQMLIGRIVRVKTMSLNPIGMPTWFIETPFEISHEGIRYRFVGLEDEILKPLPRESVLDEITHEVSV